MGLLLSPKDAGGHQRRHPNTKIQLHSEDRLYVWRPCAFLSLRIYTETSQCLRELPHHRALWTRYIPSLGRAKNRKATYWSFTERPVSGIHSYSTKFRYQHRIFLYPLVIFGTHQVCQPLSWATLYRARYLGSVYPPGCQRIPRLSPHRKIGVPFLVLFSMLMPSRKGYCALVVSI